MQEVKKINKSIDEKFFIFVIPNREGKFCFSSSRCKLDRSFSFISAFSFNRRATRLDQNINKLTLLLQPIRLFANLHFSKPSKTFCSHQVKVKCLVPKNSFSTTYWFSRIWWTCMLKTKETAETIKLRRMYREKSTEMRNYNNLISKN